MKTFVNAILLFLISNLSWAQNSELNQIQLEFNDVERIDGGIENHRSWQLGTHFPFTNKDYFAIGTLTFQVNPNLGGSPMYRNHFVISDSSRNVGIGLMPGDYEPRARLHIVHASVEGPETPALHLGNFEQGANTLRGYLNVNQPDEDSNTNIARFRYDGVTIVTINNSGFTYQLDVNGDIDADNLFTVSDARFKSEVVNIDSALDDLRRLSPKSYYKSSRNTEKGKHKEFGFIAQELQKVYPHLVKEAPLENQEGNYLSVNYQGLIPILVAANQELLVELDEMKNELKKVKSNLERISSSQTQQ